MYYPGDLTFKSESSSIVKQKDGKYVETGSGGGGGRVYDNFHLWWKTVTGPFSIVFDPEEHCDPAVEIRRSYRRFKESKSLDAKFMFAEEAFHISREAPEALVMYCAELVPLIEEMAFHFLLYDDIAVHPVKLHCSQEAMQLVLRVKKGEL
jgi:hypothetical protein